MTKVANPIYDVVFKYLMEDERIAKMLISALIEMDVIELEMKPQEYATDVQEKTLTVYRIDFKSRIRTKNGEEHLVLIELQKAKFPADIMRFRRYLGKQYANPTNSFIDEFETQIALPIISIYFLGYPLENYPEIPIIKVARQYIDHATKEIIGNKKEYFIESLTHDTVIVQIQAIKKKKHRTRLEKALSVFEQGKVHEVSIVEDDYPDEYRPIIRRLVKALANPELRDVMEAEDDILYEFQRQERLREKLKKEKEDAIKREKEAKEKIIKMAKFLLQSNTDIEKIIELTGLNREEIQNLL